MEDDVLDIFDPKKIQEEEPGKGCSTSELEESAKRISGQKAALCIYSEVLKDTIWLVSDKKCLKMVPKGQVVYYPHEILNIVGLGPEELKTAHMIKKKFCGVIQDPEKLGNAEQKSFEW